MERERSGRADGSTVGGPKPVARRPARSRGLACGIFLLSLSPKRCRLGRGFGFFLPVLNEREEREEMVEEGHGAEATRKEEQQQRKGRREREEFIFVILINYFIII